MPAKSAPTIMNLGRIAASMCNFVRQRDKTRRQSLAAKGEQFALSVAGDKKITSRLRWCAKLRCEI
jgi:hypothetical protein